MGRQEARAMDAVMQVFVLQVRQAYRGKEGGEEDRKGWE